MSKEKEGADNEGEKAGLEVEEGECKKKGGAQITITHDREMKSGLRGDH